MIGNANIFLFLYMNSVHQGSAHQEVCKLLGVFAVDWFTFSQQYNPVTVIPACDMRCHIGPVMTTLLHNAAVPMSRPHINGAEVEQLEDGMHFKWEEHIELSLKIMCNTVWGPSQ